MRACRSALYVPASNARALEKARTLPADCIILDLEDSVAPERKSEARGAALAALKARAFAPRLAVIRANGLDTPYGAEDLAAAAASGADGVLLPKVERDDAVLAAGRRLADAGAPPALALWAMIETPAAILSAATIAAAGARMTHNRLGCFILGPNDLAKALRLPGRAARARLATSLDLAVLAARAHDLVILDGVYNDIADAAGFEAECRDGALRGFDGKTLIHPSQIEPANRIFAPDADAIAEARAIVAAFATPEAQGKGAIALNGRMIERLHLAEAKRVLALAAATENAER